jgi:hypothetical protein
VYLKIIPPNADVPIAIQKNSGLRAFTNGEDEMFLFGLLQPDKIIEIYDFLGRTLAVIQIPTGTESIVMPMALLHPGFYFARLGDQVAKFVVPPR